MIWKNFEFGNSCKGGNGGYGPVPLRQCHRLLCGRVTSILFIVLLLSSKLPHLARSEGLVAIQETEERNG